MINKILPINMSRLFSGLFIALTALLFFGSCAHETDEFDGPLLIDRFGEFTVIDSLEVDRASVDFSAGESVTFSAQFNKRINWVVVITGKETGAVKIIEGFDNTLGASNAQWSGGVTELPFFNEEQCTVELIIPEEDSLTMTAEVEVLGKKVYEGSVFTDFEEEPADNIFFGNFEFELTPNSGRQQDNPANGDWYYLFEGTDDVVSNFFVGLININSSITGQTYAPVPTTVPEDCYFNAFIYADGGPHGIAVIQFVYDANDSGAYEESADQIFQIEGDYPLNWVGWRQISHSMADLGMTEEQLSKIVTIRALLISDMNSQPSPPLQVDYGLDFLTFTAGGPLKL
jgi:hypothetical protein